MRFDFAYARYLYARGIHPRVLLSAADVAALKRKTRGGDGRRILDAIRNKVRPLVEKVRKADDLMPLLQGDPGRMNWEIPGVLHDMAMVGVLDEDDRTIQAACRALLALPVFLAKRYKMDQTAYGSLSGIYSMAVGGHPFAYDLLHSHLTVEQRSAYCGWIVEGCIRPAAAHTNYYKNAGANIPIAETLPVLMGLLAVNGDPGVPGLEDEIGQLISFLEASLHTAINVDGYPEEDTGYGTAIAGFLAQIAEPLRRAGWFDVYAACPRYARVGQAVLHFVQPWGEHLLNTGDHWPNFGWRELILARQAAETRDPALLWLLGTLSYEVEASLTKQFHVPATALSLVVLDEFKNAAHPTKNRTATAFHDRGRGIVSFRSGWGDDDALLVFDGSHRSPAAQGHAHASCGHFSFFALGECFAIASGRYNMEQNCHNVVLVDGKSGRSTDGEWRGSYEHGNLIEYQPGEFVDFAAVDSSHQHNCYWARRYIGLVKGKGATPYVWIVEDINKANDWAEYWWQLHTSPENVIELRSPRRESGDVSRSTPSGHRLTSVATIRGWRKGILLDVHFALPAPHEYPKPHTLSLTQDIATPSSHNYIKDPHERAKQCARPADMVHGIVFERPRLIAKVSGYNGRFLSILLPRPKGGRPARVERLSSLDNSLAVRISFENVEDTFIWAYEHNLLEAGGISARGQWTLARRSRRSGRVTAQTTGHLKGVARDSNSNSSA